MAGNVSVSVHEPPQGCPRWTPSRKGWVVHEITAGHITPEAAAERWGLDPAEIEDWQAKYAEHGLDGLSVQRIQTVQRRPLYRPSYAHQGSGGR